MKKKLFGTLMLATLFALPMFVNAEEKQPSDFNDSKDVIVGSVETTVYLVDVEWDNLSFDWKYDRDTNKFEFVPPLACQAIDTTNASMIEELQGYVADGIGVFDNDTCTTTHTGEFTSGTTYYAQSGVYPTVHIEDRSINGKIKAKASFTPSGSYADWVVGKFYDYTSYTNKKVVYHDELTDGYFTSSPITVGGQLSEGGTIVGYFLAAALKLDINSEYTGEKVVESGSTIGTITLEISQDND